MIGRSDGHHPPDPSWVPSDWYLSKCEVPPVYTEPRREATEESLAVLSRHPEVPGAPPCASCSRWAGGRSPRTCREVRDDPFDSRLRFSQAVAAGQSQLCACPWV